MALFKRAQLKDKGLTDEQIEFILTESGRALAADYIPKSEIPKIEPTEPQKIDVKADPEYQKVAGEAAMLRALSTDDFSSVKPKFRETVYGLLDHGEKHKPYAEQIPGIAEKYEEYFVPKPAEPPKPQFGAPVEGKMPTGNENPTFGDAWGFVPQKK